MALQATKFKCTFCDREFVRKPWFERHSCTKKQRFLDRNNITVIRAHRLFIHWQRRTGLLRRGKEKTLEDFCKSPFYNAFINLSKFTSAEYVISGFKYVDWLVDNSIPERKWCNERDLDGFREYIRENEDALSQAEKTCKNIRVWCADNGIDIPEFFKCIPPGQALNMVRENKLSPWVLLGYDPCVEELVSRFRGEVLHMLYDHINVPYWLDKIEQDVDDTQKVRQILDGSMNAT